MQLRSMPVAGLMFEEMVPKTICTAHAASSVFYHCLGASRFPCSRPLYYLFPCEPNSYLDQITCRVVYPCISLPMTTTSARYEKPRCGGAICGVWIHQAHEEGQSRQSRITLFCSAFLCNLRFKRLRHSLRCGHLRILLSRHSAHGHFTCCNTSTRLTVILDALICSLSLFVLYLVLYYCITSTPIDKCILLRLMIYSPSLGVIKIRRCIPDRL